MATSGPPLRDASRKKSSGATSRRSNSARGGPEGTRRAARQAKVALRARRARHPGRRDPRGPTAPRRPGAGSPRSLDPAAGVRRRRGWLPIYTPTPSRIGRRSPGEIEELHRKSLVGRSQRHLWVYDLLSLRVVAQKGRGAGLAWRTVNIWGRGAASRGTAAPRVRLCIVQ